MRYLISLVVVGTFFFAQNADACRCTGIQGELQAYVAKKLKNSDFIAVAKITKETEHSDRFDYSISVLESIKGKASTISSAKNSCGFYPTIGDEVLVISKSVTKDNIVRNYVGACSQDYHPHGKDKVLAEIKKQMAAASESK